MTAMTQPETAIIPRNYQIFESLLAAEVKVGGGNGENGENAQSRLAITVVSKCTSVNGQKPEAELQEVQLWLTIPQLVQIVIAFFWQTVGQGNVFTGLLKRLLEKRWKVMTSPFAMGVFSESDLDLDVPYSMPKYWHVRGKKF